VASEVNVDGAVHLVVDGGVATVTLDRPARRNALHGPMWAMVGARVDEAVAAGARVLILCGEGPHFCSGMDLKPDNPLMARLIPVVLARDGAGAEAVILDLKAIGQKLAAFPGPTFCAIEGFALGGGFELALHCDVLIAARDAKVGLPEVRVGMVPDVGGTTLLARRAGPGRAALAVSTGRTFDAAEAAAWGFVDVVVEPGQALATARAFAADVLLGGPVAVSGALAVTRGFGGAALQASFAAETAAGAGALISGEVLEGVAAFAERRPPRWPGR
jgi:enoyl-CoA hydratase/carnithine racemase